MTMQPLKPNVGLAIDGGGIKGLIIAQALKALEDELGGGPLIQQPQIQILAGTSTGAIITGALAIGMKCADIAEVYKNLGQEVFPPLAPQWLPEPIQKAEELLRMVLQPHLYTNTKLIEVLKAAIQKQTGKADLTLAELNESLPPDKALILTAVNINERRTKFIKSYKPDDGNWTLWEAMVASSSAPIALPVWPRTEGAAQVYYTDGGVGNYGNPAYVVAQEAVVFRGYAPDQVSVISFGTGWVNGENYQKANGVPTGWHGLNWALNAPNLLTGDAMRAQSLDIVEGFGSPIDYRRFQFTLEQDISSDAYGSDETYRFMEQLGDQLGERIRNDQFAPNADPQYDPEGLYIGQLKYREAKTVAQAAQARRVK